VHKKGHLRAGGGERGSSTAISLKDGVNLFGNDFFKKRKAEARAKKKLSPKSVVKKGGGISGLDEGHRDSL